ncbi:cytochrome c-type biogenesis protein [Marinobacter sp. CHS3-4]|uniref:cytochrome c-type biogenesis protein n=1 Tax=Marinobacter sp. CHS3-4 TaxID=3045174 RepID=UPI0024B59ABC|nr:cytochrome c-type biogenesis protein [Marinobacter sp. CHS3-4]MDI9245871.1 cytochrome c-type biogenesis protein CcmH [Marinobacter sp. CHS3-4]
MKPLFRFALLMLLSLSAGVAVGQARDVYEFDSPEQEQRFQSLIAELRCPKCQNQNIADSNAPISKDMREAVYRMMSDGASDEKITSELVSRFGEFVRYKPKVDERTIMLWATPALVVFIGVLVIALTVRRSSKKAATETPLSDQERARADELLNRHDKNDH